MKLNKPARWISVWILVPALLMITSTVPALGAQPPSTINYQGYLTDSGGTALEGAYTLVFRLYDAASGGAIEWGPETHNSVPVSKGIFQVALGSTVALFPNDFDEALFLDVQVNGESMTPRQPLHTVAYAYGLVPGAEVEGDPAMTNYALRVDNTGEAANDRGLYVSGEQYGIYAEEVGASSDVGIYTPDFIEAKGYRSGLDSYLWVPGNAAVLYPTTGCALYSQWHGSVRLECSGAGTKDINLPITVPGVLFGQDVQVESIMVYYDLDNTGSFISETHLRKFTGAGQSVSLISNTTNRTSTTPTSYSLTPTDNFTLGTASGSLNLFLRITHDGNTTHDVNIGGVRVRLGHTQ